MTLYLINIFHVTSNFGHIRSDHLFGQEYYIGWMKFNFFIISNYIGHDNSYQHGKIYKLKVIRLIQNLLMKWISQYDFMILIHTTYIEFVVLAIRKSNT